MLDIEDLFDKIKTAIQAYPLYLYLDIADENPHRSFGSSSSDFYYPPPCRNFTN